jgi:hypothetical protein
MMNRLTYVNRMRCRVLNRQVLVATQGFLWNYMNYTVHGDFPATSSQSLMIMLGEKRILTHRFRYLLFEALPTASF